MTDKVRIVVIGCGMISNFHVKAIRTVPQTELAGFYDAYLPGAEKAAERENVKVYRTLQEVWDDETVAAVSICTPSGTHGSLAIDALSHGKHVLMEKPMALTEAECLEVKRIAEEKGLQAGAVSQLRFAPGIRKVKETLDSGLLGKLFSVELRMKYYRAPAYYAGSNWKGTKKMDGGGALMNQGIHGVDIMQHLAGMPDSVYAQCRTLLHSIEVEDTMTAVLSFPNGALGTIIATTNSYPGFSRELAFCGENGTIVLEEDSIKYWNVKSNTEIPVIGETLINGSSDPSQIDASGHVRQMENFANAIMGREKLLIPAEEGMKPLKIIWGVYASAEENKKIDI